MKDSFMGQKTLEKLDLSCNKINDISDLSEALAHDQKETTLRELFLCYNKIAIISPLAESSYGVPHLRAS